MTKYNFVLYSGEHKEFLDKLQEMGLVDITINGWEPTDEQRAVIANIESHKKAIELCQQIVAENVAEVDAAKSLNSAEEAFAAYTESAKLIDATKTDIARTEKEIEESAHWGEFSPETIAELKAQGVDIRLFSCYNKEYDALIEDIQGQYMIQCISEDDGIKYFAVVANSQDRVEINAQEVKVPDMTSTQKKVEVVVLRDQLAKLQSEMFSVAKSVDLLEDRCAELEQSLELSRVMTTAQKEVDGAIVLMEGWAASQSETEVDKIVEEYPNLIYIKNRPTPDDDTPVKLKNKWYPHLFELVGNMYALPKYGTIDLTPFFAPFYMLFFAICLCDAGYGMMILALGLGILFKMGDDMRQAGWLSIICGASAMVFGFFANSFFGMEFSSLSIFENFKFINFQKDFFSLSMIIGIFQILMGMLINIVVTTRSFGFKYALGSLGWFILIFSLVLSAGLSSIGIDGFSFTSIPFYIAVGIALVLMLFLNSPGKNIFANFGAGIWNTYNNITGLLSDVLSYVRLFAIGLSGGVLAIVFNNLAIGMTGLDAGVDGMPIGSLIAKIIGAAIILLIGHGINLFMSAISSVVHPMRLTFVEFFKNAGFEMATREFKPLQKIKK